MSPRPIIFRPGSFWRRWQWTAIDVLVIVAVFGIAAFAVFAG